MEPPMSEVQAQRGRLAWWREMPLYLQILIACVVGAAVGVALRELNEFVQNQESFGGWLSPLGLATWLAVPARMVLQLLTALAAPLVLIAVVQALMHAQIPADHGRRVMGLLLLIPTVAIFIVSLVANVAQPVKRTALSLEEAARAGGLRAARTQL